MTPLSCNLPATCLFAVTLITASAAALQDAPQDTASTTQSEQTSATDTQAKTNTTDAGDATAPASDADGTKAKISLTKLAPILTPVSDYSGSFLERSTITGDWSGARTRLYEQGIMYDMSLTQVFQGITYGGTDNGDTVYTGLLDYELNLDTGKLDLWSGGLITIQAQSGWASGDPLGTGNVSPTNFTAIYPTADKPDTQLMEYYLTQALSEDFGVIIGRVNAVNFLDVNSFANQPENQFLNISMGNNPLFGAFISFSTYGILAQWQVTENFSISPAVFDPVTQPGNYAQDLFSEWGFAAEFKLKWKIGGELDGSVLADVIYVTKDSFDLDNPRLPIEILEGVPLPTSSGNWIVSLNAEQYLWTPEVAVNPLRTAAFDLQKPGVGLFGRFAYTPADKNLWNMFASGGVGGRGIIPGRPYDRMGVGLYWLIESNDLPNVADRLLEDEWGIEAYYNWAITPSVQLSFDAQWIDSGVSGNSDVVVLGMRLFTQF